MDGHATKRQSWILLVLIFIILRTLFALMWDVATVGASGDCHTFADVVFNYLGVSGPELALCEPDFNSFAGVGDEPESFLILDMGLDREIIDGPGVDFYYYERNYPPGILLDRVVVSVAQDDGTGSPASFVEVFIWGDENPENNGVLPPSYLPEEPNKPINSSDLYSTTGIGIDIGKDDLVAYRFVRFQTYPIDAMPANDELAEVDAVERIHPHPPTLTPTLIPVETPSLTLTPEPSETPSNIPAEATAFTETPSDISTLATSSPELPAETSTEESAEPTESETLIPRPTETYTLTALVITTSTNTPIETASLTSTATYTFTPTFTFTPVNTVAITPTPTSATTIIATRTPRATPTSSKTQTATYTLTATAIASSTPTSTATWTPRPEEPTDTPIVSVVTIPPRTSATPRPSSTPSVTRTSTETPTATSTEAHTVTNPLTTSTNSTIKLTSTRTITPTTTRTPIITSTPLQSTCEQLTNYVSNPENKMLIIFSIVTSILAAIIYTFFIENAVKWTRDTLRNLTVRWLSNAWTTIQRLISIFGVAIRRLLFLSGNWLTSQGQRFSKWVSTIANDPNTRKANNNDDGNDD